MNFHVTNGALNVGSIRIVGVASSSVVLIGDTDTISLTSAFDTPPESAQVGPAIMPLAEEPEEEEAGEGTAV